MKKMPKQKLFWGNMVQEFTTVAEGIHFPSKPEALKNARLQMAINTIDRIEERLLKFKAGNCLHGNKNKTATVHY